MKSFGVHRVSFVMSVTFSTAFLVSFPITTSSAEESPASGKAGISLVVAKGNYDDPSGLGRYANMDFVLKESQIADRAMRISGSQTDDCLISMQILDSEIVNDKIRPANRVSPMIQFASFSENNFLLPAGEVKLVYLTVEAPDSVQDSINYGFVSVECSVPKSEGATETENEEITADVTYVASYLEWIRVITGDPDFVAVKFELTDVGGLRSGEQKFLRLFIDNASMFAIQPRISVELVSEDFTNFRFGPLEYSSPPIAAQEKASVDLPIPVEVTDGNWRIFVRAVEGNYTKQREFNKYLTFGSETYEEPIVIPWYEIILGTLILVIVILLIALTRSNVKKSQSTPPRSSRASRQNRKARNSEEFLDSLSEPDEPANPDSQDEPPRPN